MNFYDRCVLKVLDIVQPLKKLLTEVLLKNIPLSEESTNENVPKNLQIVRKG